MSRPSKPFRAQYFSLCVECSGEILTGDEIVMTDDGAAHLDCADVDDEPNLPTFPI